MTLRTIAIVLLQLSIFLTVFTVALDANLGETLSVLRKPAKLVRSIAVMSLAMPLLVAGALAIVPMAPLVKISLAAISVSPVPPFLPNKLFKLGASKSYVVSLLVCAALLSLFVAPLFVLLLGRLLGVEAHIGIGSIAITVARSVLLPLAGGMLVRHYWPRIADALGRPCTLFATGLLSVIGIAIIAGMAPLMMSLIGTGAVWAFIVFVLVGLRRATFSAVPNLETAPCWHLPPLAVIPGSPRELPPPISPTASSPSQRSVSISS